MDGVKSCASYRPAYNKGGCCKSCRFLKPVEIPVVAGALGFDIISNVCLFFQGDHVQSDDEIDSWVRQNADTAYHPSCTCKMGAEDDPMAVVNEKLEVLGVENLRIVDASIMPTIASGNLNGPTIMIAEKAADIILGNPPLPKSTAPVYKTPEKGQR